MKKTMIKKQRPLLLLVALLATYGEVAHGSFKALNDALGQNEAAVKQFCVNNPEFCAKQAQRDRILAKYPRIFDVVALTTGGGGGGPVLLPGQEAINFNQQIQDAIVVGDPQTAATLFNAFSITAYRTRSVQVDATGKMLINRLGGTISTGTNGFPLYTPPGGIVPPPVPVPPGPIPFGPPAPPAPPFGPAASAAKVWASALTKSKESFDKEQSSLKTAIPNPKFTDILNLQDSWSKFSSIFENLVLIISTYKSGYTDVIQLETLAKDYKDTLTYMTKNSIKAPTLNLFPFDIPTPTAVAGVYKTIVGTLLNEWVKEFLKTDAAGSPKYKKVLKLQTYLSYFSSYVPLMVNTYEQYAESKGAPFLAKISSLKTIQETNYLNEYQRVVAQLKAKIIDLKKIIPTLTKEEFYKQLEDFEKPLTNTASSLNRALEAYKTEANKVKALCKNIKLTPEYNIKDASGNKTFELGDMEVFIADVITEYTAARAIKRVKSACSLKALDDDCAQAKETVLQLVIDQDPTTGIFGASSTIAYAGTTSPFAAEIKADLSLPLILPKETVSLPKAVIGILKKDYAAPPNPSVFDLGPWAVYAPADQLPEAIFNANGGYDLYLWAPQLAEAPTSDTDANLINLHRLYLANAQMDESSNQLTPTLRFSAQCILSSAAPAPVMAPPPPAPIVGAGGPPPPPPPPPAPGPMMPMIDLKANTCLYKIYSYNKKNFGGKEFEVLVCEGDKKAKFNFGYLDKQYMNALKRLEKNLGYLGPKPVALAAAGPIAP